MSGYKHNTVAVQELVCVIIAQRWAVWLHIAKCLKIVCLELHMSDVTGPWFPSEFSSTVLLLSHKSLTSSILNSRCDLILFRQGDDHLLSLIPSIWFDTHCILWARDVSSTSHISQFSNGFHTCLNPIQHKGVLCGQYHFFSNRPFLPPPKPSVIQRRLCHIINPATKGITSHLTSATKSDPVSANSP